MPEVTEHPHGYITNEDTESLQSFLNERGRLASNDKDPAFHSSSKTMKTAFAAATLLALVGSQAIAYDRNQSLGEEWQQRSQISEAQRIEQAARQRETEHNNRLQQLDRQLRLQQQENEWRQRQLEAEQYRLWLWRR